MQIAISPGPYAKSFNLLAMSPSPFACLASGTLAVLPTNWTAAIGHTIYPAPPNRYLTCRSGSRNMQPTPLLKGIQI